MTAIAVRLITFTIAAAHLLRTEAFAPSAPLLSSSARLGKAQETLALYAKKRRRRRKDASGAAKSSAVPPVAPSGGSTPLEVPTMDSAEVDPDDVDLNTIAEVAEFSFDGAIDDKLVQDGPESPDNAIPLPDIKEVLKKKEMEDRVSRMEAEQEFTKTKIKRSDKKAVLKLLEQDPYADADDSFFEEEEYNTVSALLGERAKKFLGIPTGPLQVGHTIGALVIVLMAFVEYPGFPLTNFPSPLRGALQGGLGTIYAINLGLAIWAIFKAGERDQPAVLWFAKTFTTGGLAFDQLTQLPTVEQVEKAKARKGKRALKNQKKYN